MMLSIGACRHSWQLQLNIIAIIVCVETPRRAERARMYQWNGIVQRRG